MGLPIIAPLPTDKLLGKKWGRWGQHPALWASAARRRGIVSRSHGAHDKRPTSSLQSGLLCVFTRLHIASAPASFRACMQGFPGPGLPCLGGRPMPFADRCGPPVRFFYSSRPPSDCGA
uniref:Uncharacterized protein n=1 Tax=Oryza sativa subsp. japonica TaxID=39947 RepID=Q7Y0A7_ORYSJ|nr:hypothetical protein [Oryza sativa Japonica Group]